MAKHKYLGISAKELKRLLSTMETPRDAASTIAMIKVTTGGHQEIPQCFTLTFRHNGNDWCLYSIREEIPEVERYIANSELDKSNLAE